MSPFRTDATALVDRFATSPERKQILEGLFNFRSHLRSLGIFGFQWFDGSFCEDIEKTEMRAPRDIDVVTFFYRLAAVLSAAEWQSFFAANRSTFIPSQNRASFSCDAYFVDLSLPSTEIVSHTRYWFGLFSHKRAIGIWKGMLQVPLEHSDDAAAISLLKSK